MDNTTLYFHPQLHYLLKRIVEAIGFDKDILRNFKTLITLPSIDFSQTSYILSLEYIWGEVNSGMWNIKN